MKIKAIALVLLLTVTVLFSAIPCCGRDLEEIRRHGVLRHLGVPYANFITGDGEGLTVELIRRFARYLGVRYVFIESSWNTVIGDLIGKQVLAEGDQVKILGDTPMRGDLIATGMTVLPWREKILDFSSPTLPTQVWLITSSQSDLVPITPSGSTVMDIAAAKAKLTRKTLLGQYTTSIDPRLYSLEKYHIQYKNFTGNLNELVPAVINGYAETALLDLPDVLVALTRWPGQFKIIGPISQKQNMAVAFAKNTPHLRAAFNTFFLKIQSDGTYRLLVKKYYPDIFEYYPDFFNNSSGIIR